MQKELIVPKKARLNAVCTSAPNFSSRMICRARCCISSAARFVKVTTTRRGRISAALTERAIDKTRCVIAVVLPEPADATTEKFRSSSSANRARADSSVSLTMFPTPLFRARARDGLVPIYPPKCRYRFAMSRVDMVRCNQTRDESRLSFRKRRCAAFPRDRRKRLCEAPDRQQTTVVRHFSPPAKECSRSLRCAKLTHRQRIESELQCYAFNKTVVQIGRLQFLGQTGFVID